MIDDPPADENRCPPENEVPDLRPVEGPEADAELAEMAKRLAHPFRIQIHRLLARRGTCHCGEIVEEMPLEIQHEPP